MSATLTYTDILIRRLFHKKSNSIANYAIIQIIELYVNILNHGGGYLTDDS